MGSATEKEYQWSNRPKLAIEPDRSSAERKPEKQPHCLTITFDDHVVVGVVVDCSADGLGVQTFEPLPLGADAVEGPADYDQGDRKDEGEATQGYRSDTSVASHSLFRFVLPLPLTTDYSAARACLRPASGHMLSPHVQPHNHRHEPAGTGPPSTLNSPVSSCLLLHQAPAHSTR